MAPPRTRRRSPEREASNRFECNSSQWTLQGKRPARSSAVRDLYQALWRADNHEDMLGMANVSIIFGLLVIPYLFAYLFQFKNLTMAGRIGVCAVFLFTAIGHFFKTRDMTAMLPPFIPARRALIYLSGILEVVFAIAVVAFPNPYLGWVVIIYLIVIFPSNVYTAFQRI
jgi:hypothetical protein